MQNLQEFISNVSPHRSAERLANFGGPIATLQKQGYSARQITSWLITSGVDTSYEAVLEFVTTHPRELSVPQEQKPVGQALRELLGKPESRTKIGHLRSNYEEIAALVEAGVSASKIVAQLKKVNVTMTVQGFNQAWNRVKTEKAERRKKNGVRS